MDLNVNYSRIVASVNAKNFKLILVQNNLGDIKKIVREKNAVEENRHTIRKNT